MLVVDEREEGPASVLVEPLRGSGGTVVPFDAMVLGSAAGHNYAGREHAMHRNGADPFHRPRRAGRGRGGGFSDPSDAPRPLVGSRRHGWHCAKGARTHARATSTSACRRTPRAQITRSGSARMMDVRRKTQSCRLPPSWVGNSMRISTSSPVCHVLASSVRRMVTGSGAALRSSCSSMRLMASVSASDRSTVTAARALTAAGKRMSRLISFSSHTHCSSSPPPATKAHLHEELLAPLEDVATSLELGEAGEVELGLLGHADRAELDTSLVDQAGEGFVVAGF